MAYSLTSALMRSTLCVFLVCCILPSAAAYGQQPDVRFRVYVRLVDSLGATKPVTAYFGVHSLGSYCIDTLLTRFTDNWFEVKQNQGVYHDTATEFSSYPPCPPTQELRIRNVSTSLCKERDGITPLGARPVNIHNFHDTLQVDTFRITWCSIITGDANAPKQVFSWPPPIALQQYCDSMFFLTNTNVKINMLTNSRYVYSPALDTNASFSSARIFLYHPKSPPHPPDTVVAIKPLNGTLAFSPTDSLKWNSIPQVFAYKVQLALDRKFQNIVHADSAAQTFVPLNGIAIPGTWYYWRVIAFSPFGVSYYRSPADSFKTQSVEAVKLESDVVPKSFALYQNYPNPFNPVTEIRFDIRTEGMTDIMVYNVLGQKVAVLVSGGLLPGIYVTTWNGTSDAEIGVISGVYFVQMTVHTGNGGVFSSVRKIVFMK